MRILLINPPWYRLFGEELDAFPLGLSYLGGVLEKNGFHVCIYNADHDKGAISDMSGGEMMEHHKRYLEILSDLSDPIWDEVRKVVKEQNPDIVGINVWTPKLGSALNVARICKEFNPNTKIIFGGVHATIMPDDVLKSPYVDIAVRMEGELTMVEVAQKIQAEEPLDNVLGISFKKENSIVSNDNRPFIENLDDIPFPARHLLLDRETYHSNAFGKIFASRGCPYQCNYCGSNKIWTRKVRYRSPKNVVDEMEYVKKEYGSTHFVFEDDLLTINKKFLTAICDELIERKLDVEWSCETRANLVFDDLIKKMKQAGCTGIVVGIESGSAKILKDIKKGIVPEQIYNAAKIIKDNGVIYSAFFMMGFPTETKEDIMETVKVMKETQPFNAVLSVLTPYPDSEIYYQCLEMGLLPKDIDWSRFYHQSPDNFFMKYMTKQEFDGVKNWAMKMFDDHNKSQKRAFLMKHPIYTARRIIKNKYYTPKNMARLIKMVS
ncbi:MAG: radical SAM protein [Candidatus Aenigmarchaeota archaeon]|nr:radical SAM protein [Candidatus Aenigmarchaeota archaeon]